MISINPPKNKYILSCSILTICLIYWVYLFLNSRMEIIFDASVFDKLGQSLFQDGWHEYVTKHGTDREPLYIFLISSSHWLSAQISIPYLEIQKIFQILIIAISQILIYLLLNKLNVNRLIKWLTILYFSISPAITNSTFSLYYEIATYPFILGIILLSINMYQNINQISVPKFISWTLLICFLSVALIFTKFPFYYILLIYYAPFYVLTFKQLYLKKINLFWKYLILIIALLTSINLSAHLYKRTNQYYNGNFAFTERGNWMIYASTYKRTQNISLKNFLTYLSTIPGDGICRQLFTPSDCDYWTHVEDSAIGSNTSQQLKQSGLTDTEVNKEFLHMTVNLIKKHPIKQISFNILESIKMFFWESTQIGCVTYPEGLKKLYDNALFKNGLRLVVSLLTITAFLRLLTAVLVRRKSLLKENLITEDETTILMFIILMITLTAGFYSFFSVLTRFSFPIVSLFLICIAYFLDRTFIRKNP